MPHLIYCFPPDQCDPQTGQCKCKLGWVGTECDACAPGHFGLRCRPCLCNAAGTRGCEDGVCSCDDEGRCPCKVRQIQNLGVSADGRILPRL